MRTAELQRFPHALRHRSPSSLRGAAVADSIAPTPSPLFPSKKSSLSSSTNSAVPNEYSSSVGMGRVPPQPAASVATAMSPDSAIGRGTTRKWKNEIVTRPAVRAFAAASLAVLLAGCAHWSADAPDTPSTRWTPPAGAVAPAPTPVPPPPEFAPEKLTGRTISLAEAVDVALRNSPVTRQSWLLARAAAAGVGGRRSALFPSVELDAQAGRQKQTSSGAYLSTLLTTYGPTASLSFLVLDLGGRSADIAEAGPSLYA